MELDVVIEDDRWTAAGLEDLGRRAFCATIAHLGLPETTGACLMACDDARIAELNTAFRDRPTPTNVLSWPSAERGALDPGGPPFPPEEDEIGDIALAYDTCAREAAEQGKPFDAHVTHLVVHGLLHLLGYDHIDDEDAALMEGLEVEILGKLGLADPYGETGA